MMHRAAALLCLTLATEASAQTQLAALGSRNKPERLEWFRDAAFGLFIHWSVDAPLGGVISHSLVGADADYTQRFFAQLPAAFNPRKFHPQDWAALARLAGMKYVVFTTKHHAGFCMYDTKTTPYNVMNTPYGKDVTAEIARAFRAEGLAVGHYFSPDDFHYLHRAGKTIARAPHEGVTPQEDAGLMQLDREQLRELMTNYGPIDVVFLDGPAEGLRELVWDLQPDTVVTRGAIDTPEQRVPGVPLDRAWEACVTMGTEWPYKPAHETYKSPTQLIELLIETRAKGGNLLLNVGPKPDGELPIEQEERLRAIALWNFVNGEAIYDVRPWVVTNEGEVWFTRKKAADTVYAFVTRASWTLGERKTVTLRSVRATPRTRVSVLGQTGEVLEYRPDVDPRPSWRQDEKGLHVSAMMAQRLYTDRKWVDPVVLKITDVEPGLTPPVVVTGTGVRHAGGRAATLRAALRDLGGAASVEVGFQYRRRKGVEELYTPDDVWTSTTLLRRRAAGEYAVEVDGLRPDEAYEFRAMARHPLLTVHGEDGVLPRPGAAP
ncbi:MAG TPA: alpha-L-fucosidase [Vicinamibacteria bacterium]|nr:alpha-L-fucosidase [Vicinamibacteria bacterium]